jgi:RNA polymerase sigma factor (sigma-70 family)
MTPVNLVDERVNKHLGLAYSLAASRSRRWHLQPADVDEVTSIATEALWKAAKSFKEEKATPFQAWASLVINRDVTNYLQKTFGRKGAVNNETDLYNPNAEEQFSLDRISDPRSSEPSDLADQAEKQQEIAQWLSSTEMDLLNARYHGKDYAEIGREHGFSRSWTKYAVQRAEAKIEALMVD